MQLTLRDLNIYHQQVLLDSWDHTAMTVSSIINNTNTLVNLNTKSRVKPKSYLDIHPFRKAKPQGHRITPKNIGMLKYLVMAMKRQKGGR